MTTIEPSTRSLGEAMIRSDKPTRDALKALAAREGMTLSSYLRKIANQGGQGGLPVGISKQLADVSGRVGVLNCQAVQLSRAIPMSESRRLAVLSLASKNTKFDDLKHSELLFERMQSEFELYREKVTAKEFGQLELLGDT